MSERYERKREHTRNEIIDAALSLYTERGFQMVSLENVAELANISRGTIYNFFPNRDMLLYDALAPAMQEMIVKIEALETKEIQFDDICNLFLSVYKTRSKELKLMLQLTYKEMAHLTILHETLIDKYTQLFAKIKDKQHFRFQDDSSNVYLLFKTSMPLMMMIAKENLGESLYTSAVKGLLLLQ